MAAAVDNSMISSGDLTSRASNMTCWQSRTSMPTRCSSRIIGVSAMSTPRGRRSTPCSRRIDAISATALAIGPASGATAPRSPSIPARLLSGWIHGA
jgi:hypothetical protein